MPRSRRNYDAMLPVGAELGLARMGTAGITYESMIAEKADTVENAFRFARYATGSGLGQDPNRRRPGSGLGVEGASLSTLMFSGGALVVDIPWQSARSDGSLLRSRSVALTTTKLRSPYPGRVGSIIELSEGFLTSLRPSEVLESGR
jgi:hypothetical protein